MTYREKILTKACHNISTHALEYGVIRQLIEACEAAQQFIMTSPQVNKYNREYELLRSQLELVLAKVKDIGEEYD